MVARHVREPDHRFPACEAEAVTPADGRGIRPSEAELIREAIAALVQTGAQPRPRGGLFESGDSALAEHVDEALAGFGER